MLIPIKIKNICKLESKMNADNVHKLHTKKLIIIEFFLPKVLVSIINHPIMQDRNSGVHDNAISLKISDLEFWKFSIDCKIFYFFCIWIIAPGNAYMIPFKN